MELIIKEAGARLDKALADLTDLSRSQANDEIKKGTVLVNGKAVKAKYAVKVGDVVTYEVPEEEVLEYTAENIPLDIVYEDEDVAVVYKPQGMVVHPSVGHTSGTLVNALMYHIKGKPAVTHFKVLERFGNYTLVELTLETGRTHQIRVHMAYIGHPVAGDPLYGPRKTLKGNGQFLHAQTLGFTHPKTGETMTFTAEVPAIFKETLEKLRSGKA